MNLDINILICYIQIVHENIHFTKYSFFIHLDDNVYRIKGTKRQNEYLFITRKLIKSKRFILKFDKVERSKLTLITIGLF